MVEHGPDIRRGVEECVDIRKRIGQTVIYGESRYMKRTGLEGWESMVWVEHGVGEHGSNIRKRIGQTVIYGESRYMKRNGLDGVSRYTKRSGLDGWVSMVEYGPNIRKRIGETVIYGVSRYMKRNGVEEDI